MKVLVAINPKFKNKFIYKDLGNVDFGGTNIDFGLVDLPRPKFNNKSDKDRDFVLVKVNALSCNFRDKGILLNNYENLVNTNQLYLPFGSEFSGTVVDFGADVKEFSINEKVIPDCSYPKENKSIRPGIPTNFASLGWLRLHKDKLISAPKALTDSQSACFPLGAQTAHSMIRRSGILEAKEPKALVFSAKSATSLFIIRGLLANGIKPVCFSTSKWSEEELNAIDKLDVKDDYSSLITNIPFTHVFDPFFDINIEKAINLLSIYGTYITCGLNNQHPALSNGRKLEETETRLRSSILTAIVKNVSVIGNCLGVKDDLKIMLSMIDTNIGLKPIIDSEFSLSEGICFIEKTFFEPTKFGKCVLNYGEK